MFKLVSCHRLESEVGKEPSDAKRQHRCWWGCLVRHTKHLPELWPDGCSVSHRIIVCQRPFHRVNDNLSFSPVSLLHSQIMLGSMVRRVSVIFEVDIYSSKGRIMITNYQWVNERSSNPKIDQWDAYVEKYTRTSGIVDYNLNTSSASIKSICGIALASISWYSP